MKAIAMQNIFGLMYALWACKDKPLKKPCTLENNIDLIVVFGWSLDATYGP
jgi:hypothetical protein